MARDNRAKGNVVAMKLPSKDHWISDRWDSETKTKFIPLRGITAFIGKNGAGKTRTLAGIRRLFDFSDSGMDEETFGEILISASTSMPSQNSGSPYALRSFDISLLVKELLQLAELDPQLLLEIKGSEDLIMEAALLFLNYGEENWTEEDRIGMWPPSWGSFDHEESLIDKETGEINWPSMYDTQESSETSRRMPRFPEFHFETLGTSKWKWAGLIPRHLTPRDLFVSGSYLVSIRRNGKHHIHASIHVKIDIDKYLDLVGHVLPDHIKDQITLAKVGRQDQLEIGTYPNRIIANESSFFLELIHLEESSPFGFSRVLHNSLPRPLEVTGESKQPSRTIFEIFGVYLNDDETRYRLGDELGIEELSIHEYHRLSTFWSEGEEGSWSVAPTTVDIARRFERDFQKFLPSFISQDWSFRVKFDPHFLYGISVLLVPLTEDKDGIYSEYSGPEYELRHQGSGVQRWVALALEIFLGVLKESVRVHGLAPLYDFPLVFIDEPEVSLHPAALNSVFRWMQELSRQGVFFILATHESKVFDLPSSVGSRHKVSFSTGEIVNLDSMGLDLVADELNEMGLTRGDLFLYSRGVLLVEGHSDQRILDAWFGDYLRDRNIVIVVLGGTKNYRNSSMVAILRKLELPIAYIIDGEPAWMNELDLQAVEKDVAGGLPIKLFGTGLTDIVQFLDFEAVKREPSLKTSFRDLGSWEEVLNLVRNSDCERKRKRGYGICDCRAKDANLSAERGLPAWDCVKDQSGSPRRYSLHEFVGEKVLAAAESTMQASGVPGVLADIVNACVAWISDVRFAN